jgi:predicted Zn-dependent peptidase
MVVSVLAAAGGPTAVVREWPAGDAAAVALVIGLHPEEAEARKAGAEALLAEMMMAQASRAFSQKTGAAAPLSKAMPTGRSIEVDRQREYMTIVIDVVGEGVPAAIGFLRQTILEAKWTEDDLAQARATVLRRRAGWVNQVAPETEDLMLRALANSPMAIGYYGSVEGIKSVGLADLKALRARLLAKDNVRVSVEAPKATEDKAIGAALDALAARLSEGVGHPPRAMWIGGDVEVKDNATVDRASVAVGFPAAPFGTREYWAARVLRELLTGNGGALVEDKQLLSRLGMVGEGSRDWKSWPVQPLQVPVAQRPYLAIHLVCSPDAVDEARDAVAEHMRSLAAGTYTDEKLGRARRRVANLWARDLSVLGQRVALRGVAALAGTELPDTKAVTALVNGVPKAMLQKVAGNMLAHMAVGVQLPRD